MQVEDLRSMLDDAASMAPGISLEQLQLVLTVSSNEGLSIQELADSREAPQSTVSRQLKRLCRPCEWELNKTIGIITIQASSGGLGYGLLEQKINPEQSKKRALFLTGRGREFISMIERS